MKDGIKEIIESRQAPGIIGSRDNFGIGKEFTDERTGKIIDNYKSWERAGFRKPNIKNEKVKEAMERKKYQYKREGEPNKIELANIPL